MINILFLVTKDDVGGAQKYVQDLAENLDKTKFEVKVLTGGKGGATLLSNAFWPHLLFINDWLALAQLFFIFRREKPDLVHLNSSKAGVIGAVAAKLAGVPKVVFTAHGWVFNPDNHWSFLRRKFFVLFHRIAARFQDRIINVSEYDKKLAVQNKIAASHKLITIRNGLDQKNLKFLDKRTARKAALTLLGPKPQILNAKGTWVGSVGRLVQEKSYEDFIQAAQLVNNPSVSFFIIGTGYQKKKLEAKIKKLSLTDRFFIIENLAPAAPYLKAFDLFLLSSIKEGLPYTLLEAMSAGLPIITTRVGGMTEIIDPLDSPKRGLVMPPGEPAELARAIDHFLENPKEAERLASEGNKFVKEALALERVIKETEGVYLS